MFKHTLKDQGELSRLEKQHKPFATTPCKVIFDELTLLWPALLLHQDTINPCALKCPLETIWIHAEGDQNNYRQEL